MLLDVKCYVYVWIGSSAKNEEKKHAYEIAIEYLKNGKKSINGNEPR